MKFSFTPLFLLVCLASCQEAEQLVPDPPAYDTGYVLFRDAAGDTLYREAYTDWCDNFHHAELVGGGAGGASLPAYSFVGYRRLSQGRSAVLGIYTIAAPGEGIPTELERQYVLQYADALTSDNVRYVVSCELGDETYTSHRLDGPRAGRPLFSHYDSEARTDVDATFLYPTEQECPSFQEFLIRTELHYTGYLYSLSEPVDSLAVDVDMLVNIGV